MAREMGAGSRGGWYSMTGSQRRPAQRRPHPGELQNIAIGTVLPALPGSLEGFTIVQCQQQDNGNQQAT